MPKDVKDMTDEELHAEWNLKQGGQRAVDLMLENKARREAKALAERSTCPGTGRDCVFYNTQVKGDNVLQCDGCGKRR
jgi:hypothetical protein